MDSSIPGPRKTPRSSPFKAGGLPAGARAIPSSLRFISRENKPEKKTEQDETKGKIKQDRQ